MIKTAQGIKVETLTQPTIGQWHHAHCSGVVAWLDGEILVVYYHAIKEANRQQTIFGIRKKAGQSTWSKPFVVSKDKPNRMEGNPSIWIAPDGKLWLFYVTSPGGWAVCTPRYKISEDRGQTWTKSTKLYWLFSRGIKNPPIITSKGWYILPAYVEFRDYYSMFYLSKDKGKTWKDPGARVGVQKDIIPYDLVGEKHQWERLVLQPTVIERKDGSIFCLNRAVKKLGKMYVCESFDGGETWTQAQPGVLPNPGGGFHMIRLFSGNIAIVYNHAPAEPLNSFERNPVSVAISDDDGHTWKYRRNLCEFHPDDPTTPEDHRQHFAYPTIYQSQDEKIHVTWSFSHPEKRDGMEFNFTDIQYTCFTEEWVKEHPYFEGAWEL